MPELAYRSGDLTTFEADALVSPADRRLRGGGGLDGAIHTAGGPAILRECVERYPDGIAVGDAAWTTAGELPARWVIHTAGPDYGAGERDRSLLVACYRRSLQVADELGARTVATPLISAGAHGWPLDDAVDAAVGTILRTETRAVEKVTLLVRDEPTMWKAHYAVERYASRGSATTDHLRWAGSYDAYARIAAGPVELHRVLEPAIDDYRRTGAVPSWCGVDLLQAWAFWIGRRNHHQGGGSLDAEWADVLDAVRAHPDARPEDRPPDNVPLP